MTGYFSFRKIFSKKKPYAFFKKQGAEIIYFVVQICIIF
jgi:hypothetical protein